MALFYVSSLSMCILASATRQGRETLVQLPWKVTEDFSIQEMQESLGAYLNREDASSSDASSNAKRNSAVEHLPPSGLVEWRRRMVLCLGHTNYMLKVASQDGLRPAKQMLDLMITWGNSVQTQRWQQSNSRTHNSRKQLETMIPQRWRGTSWGWWCTLVVSAWLEFSRWLVD